MIELHGDIPDVHTVADFMEKIELGRPINKTEYETYIEKMNELSPDRLTMDEYYVKLEAKFQLGIMLSDIEQCRIEVFHALRNRGNLVLFN